MDSNQVHDLHVSLCVYVCFIVIAIAVSHGDDLADTILLQQHVCMGNGGMSNIPTVFLKYDVNISM